MKLLLIPAFGEILGLPARPAVQALRCRALTAGESICAVRRETNGVLRSLTSASRRQSPCTVYMTHQCRRSRHRRAHSCCRSWTNARKDSGHCRWRVNDHRLSQWAERNRKIVIPLPQTPAERQTSGLSMLAPLGRKTIGVETRSLLQKNCRELRHSSAALQDGYVLIRKFFLRITETRPCYAPDPTGEMNDSATFSEMRRKYL